MTSPLIIVQLTQIPDDKDYFAQIINSPRGTSSPVRLKLADGDEVFRLGAQPGQTLAQLKAAMSGGVVDYRQMERLGEFLYKRIFAGGVESKLSAIRIQEKQYPYRLCIRVDESAPFLETIPWEYMKGPDGFVALSLASVTRVLEDRSGEPFDPVQNASILLVYANPPGYPDKLKHATIEAESTGFIDKFVENLETQYHLKVTTLLRAQATRENFLSLLSQQQFDIIHFIGHGVVLKGVGHIVMHDEERVPGEEIHNHISRKPPRFFYFNSCSTAQADSLNPFSSVAQILIKRSVPAVIAMQYEIEVSDSFVMAKEFYETLLNPQSNAFGNLEQSLDYARRKVQIKHASWGIPVLFLQTRERMMLFGEPATAYQPAQLKLHLNSSIPPAVKLIDREAEVGSVHSLLSSNRRLLSVTGLPGVGRGAVVRAGLDEYLQDEREEIPIWLNLEGIKAEDATLATLYTSLDAILETGLKQLWNDPRRSLGDKLTELERKIPTTAILVLENIDALLDEESHFRDELMEQFFLHFGTTRRRIFIITTSSFEPKPRANAEEWNALWQTIKVEGLQPGIAVELLTDLGLTHSDTELRALAVAVDGHPQALKVLAAGIVQGSVNLRKFVGSPRAATGLTGSFAEAMMASLTEAETDALKLWSVFRNPVVREALIGVAPDADSSVDSISRKGLLQAKDSYFFLSVLVRNIAYDELQREPALLDEAHRRAADFFLKEAIRVSNSLDTLTSLSLETEYINNYLEARYHLRERVDEDSRRDAQSIGEDLFQDLMDQGRHGELKLLIEQSGPEYSNGFKVQFFKAQLEGLFGNFQGALEILELLELTVEHGTLEHGSVVNEIGAVLKERSDPRDSDEMLKCFDEAFDIFGNVIKTSDRPALLERAHHNQAICTYNRGLVYQYFRRGSTPAEFDHAYKEARKFYEAALVIYKELDDEYGISMVYSQLGQLLADTRFSESDPESGERLLREAVEIAERIYKPRVELNAAYQLARFLRRQGDSQVARALFRQAADVAERIGLPAERAIAEVQIAEIDFHDRQYDGETLDAALSRHEETLGYSDDLHSIRVQSDAYFLHGLLHLVQGNREKASRCFEDSRSVMMPLEPISQSRADAKRIARGTSFLTYAEESTPATDLMSKINEWR